MASEQSDYFDGMPSPERTALEQELLFAGLYTIKEISDSIVEHYRARGLLTDSATARFGVAKRLPDKIFYGFSDEVRAKCWVEQPAETATKHECMMQIITPEVAAIRFLSEWASLQKDNPGTYMHSVMYHIGKESNRFQVLGFRAHDETRYKQVEESFQVRAIATDDLMDIGLIFRRVWSAAYEHFS